MIFIYLFLKDEVVDMVSKNPMTHITSMIIKHQP
jgi:hypothetical protein